MKKIISLIYLFSACIVPEKKNQESFPLLTVTEDDWAAYEGKWLSHDGVIRFELFLKSGSIGVDSNYKLYESFADNEGSKAGGTISQGLYSTFQGFSNNELGIRLLDLSPYNKGVYLRFKKLQSMDMPDEMFFITRGNDELLPCDDNFKPITTDWRYTLHKRSKLFTVEGYVTIGGDSAEFFERNTFQYWSLANLGEFDELKALYKQMAKEKYEGIYVKALAYSVLDTTSRRGENALVVKRILSAGKDPD